MEQASIMYHAYRGKCGKCGADIEWQPKQKFKLDENYKNLVDENGNKIATRIVKCRECGHTGRKWLFSPHWHLQGLGWINYKKTKLLYKDTGWIVENKGVRKSVGGTAWYQGSHAVQKKGHKTVDWFGDIVRAKILTEAEKIEDRSSPVCPLCGSELRYGVYLAGKPPPINTHNVTILDSHGWTYLFPEMHVKVVR